MKKNLIATFVLTSTILLTPTAGFASNTDSKSSVGKGIHNNVNQKSSGKKGVVTVKKQNKQSKTKNKQIPIKTVKPTNKTVSTKSVKTLTPLQHANQVFKTFIKSITTTVTEDTSVYVLELNRWNVFNDGTHGAETTKGINDALQWAKKEGYTTFKLPEGTYLIDKGIKNNDTNARINMVSDMVFELDSKAVLQKEKNGFEHYTVMFVGPGVDNVTLKGGTYKGDKDTHDYYNGATAWKPNTSYVKGDKVIPPNTIADSWGYYYVAQTSGISSDIPPAWNWTKTAVDNTITWQPVARGTHEGGYGIVTSGSKNTVIDNVKAINFTGDGLALGSMHTLIDDLYKNDFKSGSVDENGNLVNDSSKVRLENLPINHPYFSIQNTFQFIHQNNLPTNHYTAYFYNKDGAFIKIVNSKDKNTPVGWGLTEIPANASYFHVVFDTPSVPQNVYVEYVMQGVTKHAVVKNSEFAFNRRQGITVGGAKDVLITNNKIHDMKGTAPQSGIDVEAGYNLNDGITVTDNHFYNNQAYDLILYDGRNAHVEGNTFDSKSIGLAVSEPFKYATIKNNTFNGARIYAYNEATFLNNKMNDALAAFLGKNIVIDGFEFQNTVVNLASSEPFGIKASNITVKNTNKETHAQFGINKNPLHLKNIHISGQVALDSFAGNAADGSIFDNLTVKDAARVQLVRGTYNNCHFESAPSWQGIAWGFEVQNTGNYEFNNCTFVSEGGGFGVSNVHGNPDSVIVRNSTIKTTGERAGMTITAGKNVVFENNTFEAYGFKDKNKVLFSIGNGYWYKNEPTKVGNVTFKGNTIKTNIPVIGIQTIYPGTGSNGYTIENNTLYTARLDLGNNDKNTGNLTK